MVRISLAKRLNALGFVPARKMRLMMDIALLAYIQAVREMIPNTQQEVYRLMRCTDSHAGVENLLCDVLFAATYNMSSDQAERVAYDILVRPFEKIRKEGKTNG